MKRTLAEIAAVLALLWACLLAPAFAQSVELLILIEKAKAGIALEPVALPPCGGGSGAGWKPASADTSPQVATKLSDPPADAPVSPPPGARTPAPAVPKLKPALNKPAATKASLQQGHWETRTRRVCKGGYCTTERYRVWVADKQGGYPIRGSWWSHPPDLKAHLIRTHGYSASYINSLSKAELESLHSDTHEGRVKR